MLVFIGLLKQTMIMNFIVSFSEARACHGASSDPIFCSLCALGVF